MALAAAVSGRAAREVGLVAVTVLVGQALLGWDNDLADRRADQADERLTKPLVSGTLDPGTLAFAVACAVLLVVPLSLSSGMNAGLAYLLSLCLGVLGDRVGARLFRTGPLSWLPWAIAFALYPAYLSYGGWGGAADGDPPTIAMTVAAAFLGVGVHVLTSLRGLVDDNRAGRRHLPLRLALPLGAPRLLVLASVYCMVVVVVIAVVGSTLGLSQ
jgi:4-hydroxybenzoate polyprenyltransferase